MSDNTKTSEKETAGDTGENSSLTVSTLTGSDDSPNVGGPPVANVNALKHGLYSPRSHDRFANRKTGVFRRHLEQAVLRQYKAVSVVQAALIQTACEVTRLAMSNRKLRREKADTLTIDQVIALDKAYANFLDIRDKKLLELKLDVDIEFVAAGLYGDRGRVAG